LEAYRTIYQNNCSNYDILDINLDSRGNDSQAKRIIKRKKKKESELDLSDIILD
jgi:hypothetical protein